MTTGRPPETILTLNRWIKDYASKHDAVFLDYFAATVDDKGMMRAEITADGLHPTIKGYELMNPQLEKAIAQALGKN
jgi:lysophospholipase L1-like esterase